MYKQVLVLSAWQKIGLIRFIVAVMLCLY